VAARALPRLRRMGRIRPNDPLLKKHLYPEPRLALGQWLSAHRKTTAMMDLSDGLSTDLPRLCAASGVGARIQSSLLPAVPRWNHQTLELALHGGDDYELLFTVRANQTLPAKIDGVPLTRVGEITGGRKVVLVTLKGSEQPLHDRGWNPFAIKSG